ncbi:MAG TPA: hypothetical protein VJ750_03165 [Rhizomicrobium sp.]|nr:hypothetical protein [Rhizomicrobium sp.]
MRRSVAGILAGALAGLLICSQASEAEERKSGVWKVLRDGNFSSPMTDEAHVRSIPGSIIARGKHYRFMEYYWEEKRPAGHGSARLLVFEQTGSGLSYLGSYGFDGADFRGPVHPEVRGKTVVFPYKDMEILGDKRQWEISFENGPPSVAFPGSVNKFVR